MNKQDSFSGIQQTQRFLRSGEQIVSPALAINPDTGSGLTEQVRKEPADSEVARVLQAIEETYESARLGLCGLSSGSARHDFIEAKMTRVDQYREQLVTLVGHDSATALIYDVLMHEGD